MQFPLFIECVVISNESFFEWNVDVVRACVPQVQQPDRVPSSHVCSSPDDRGTNCDARDGAVVWRTGQVCAFVRIVPR